MRACGCGEALDYAADDVKACWGCRQAEPQVQQPKASDGYVCVCTRCDTGRPIQEMKFVLNPLKPLDAHIAMCIDLGGCDFRRAVKRIDSYISDCCGKCGAKLDPGNVTGACRDSIGCHVRVSANPSSLMRAP